MTFDEKVVFLKHFCTQGIADPHSLLKASFLTENEIRDNLSIRKNVLWAYKCAKLAGHLIEHQETKKVAIHCLSLIEEWISTGKIENVEILLRATERIVFTAQDGGGGQDIDFAYSVIYAGDTLSCALQWREQYSTRHEERVAYLANLASHYLIRSSGKEKEGLMFLIEIILED